jgi:dipeptidyl aminopeptidase/acylaminoacyl peptidase
VASCAAARDPKVRMVPLIPLRDLFDNPERAAARVAPDGRRIAWLAPRAGVMNIWVAEIGRDDDAVPVTDDRHRGIRAYLWSRDSARILYLQDEDGDENTHLHSVDASGGRARDLTPFPGVRAGLIAAPRATPRHVLVSMNLRDRTLFDAYRLTLATGRLEVVGRNPGDILGWQEDRAGAVRAAVSQSPSGDHRILVRDRETDPFRIVAEYANEDGGHPYAFTPDGSALWVGSAKGSDLLRLVELDPSDGSEREIDRDDEADLSGPVISGRTGELLGAAYLRDRLVLNAFDERLAADWEVIRGLHSGDPRIGGQDDAEAQMIVSFDDDRDPGATFLYDRNARTARFLYRPRPWLDPEVLAPMRPVTVTSRDGLPLRSYLTLPIGLEPRGLPAVLVVHGGPWSRDAWGYDPEAQLLANRGYAVLQVNYRGSTGFGKAFMHAAEREFAGRMHDDLIDGVGWLIGQGIAHPARIGIYGGSYGGYAALVGAAFTPDVFACAVSVVGPSSLVTLIRSFPAYWRPMLAGSWFRYVGDPDDPEQRADLEARSPLSRVDDITAPLLVIQGANDPRVTKAESDQIVEALRARGVEVEYIVKEDEGHGFVRPENRMDVYRALERFLARHLGGRAEGED